MSINKTLIQKLLNKQLWQIILINLINLLFICLSFVLLRSFVVFYSRSRSFCAIFALLWDFLQSFFSIFYSLLRLLRSSANLSIEIFSAIFLRTSLIFCGFSRDYCDLLRSSVVFFNWFDISFCSLSQSSEIAILSENVILSKMTIANTKFALIKNPNAIRLVS